MKSYFFEKINKIDNLYPDQEEKEKTQITDINVEKGFITIDPINPHYPKW